MQQNEEFKSNVFHWIESIISCELPGMDDIWVEKSEADTVLLPRIPGAKDPRLVESPQVPAPGEDDTEFQKAFRETVTALAIECNWHVHLPTCFKHLEPGQPRNDSTCQMCIDGHTQRFTELDPETQSIKLWSLHPRIDNFNDFVLFLLKCNMDIKYIGSGEAAKALMFYIMDYITKSTLPAHVRLSVIEYEEE
ncbi:hypothetical protein B0H10DRAFT_1807132 [Mycena sp. CBHHK59/15]|nr:hypothetical protein B0H10DRAFT_1807132 [Mycena sp. CBHHK59/15]